MFIKNVDPDQLAPKDASLSRSTLFFKRGYTILNENAQMTFIRSNMVFVFQVNFMLNIPVVVTVLFRVRYHHMNQDIHTQVSPTM